MDSRPPGKNYLRQEQVSAVQHIQNEGVKIVILYLYNLDVWLGNKMLETITCLGKDVTHILPYYIDAYAYLLQPFVCYENTTHSCLDCKHTVYKGTMQASRGLSSSSCGKSNYLMQCKQTLTS